LLQPPHCRFVVTDHRKRASKHIEIRIKTIVGTPSHFVYQFIRLRGAVELLQQSSKAPRRKHSVDVRRPKHAHTSVMEQLQFGGCLVSATCLLKTRSV